jgi:hypothetical protein
MVSFEEKIMTNITITVNKSFGTGTQEIGLDDYVETWIFGVQSICRLGSNLDEHYELEAMQKRIKELAVKKFFELYQKEQEEAATCAALLAAAA